MIIAIETSSHVKKLNLNREIQKAENKIFRSTFLPTVDVAITAPTLNRSISSIPQDDGSIRFRESNTASSSLALDIEQNLRLTGGTIRISNSLNRLDQLGTNSSKSYSGSWLGLSYRQSLGAYNSFKSSSRANEALTGLNRLEYYENLEQLKLEVINLYFSAYIAKMKMDLSRQLNVNSKILLDLAREREKQKSITKNEILKAELSKIESESKLLNDSTSYSIKIEELRIKLGLIDSQTLELVRPYNLSVSNDLLEGNKTYSYALRNYREKKNYELVKSTEQTKKTKSEKISTNVSIGFGFNNSSEDFQELLVRPQQQQSLNFSIQKKIIDWNSASNRYQISKNQLEILKLSITQGEYELKSEISALLSSLASSFERISASKRRSELALLNYKLTNEEYLLGKANLIELNQSSLRSESALIEALESLKQSWTTYYQLRKKTLYDFENDVSLTK
ncbi:MAG: TolC family protein [Cyclobacteriaceae bacterium]